MSDAHYDRLLASLDAAVALLRRYAQRHRADWLESDRAKNARGDTYAVHHILSAFGGPGSLNDLVIHPLNGDTIEESDVDAVNSRLDTYRAEIWNAATAMKRELQ